MCEGWLIETDWSYIYVYKLKIVQISFQGASVHQGWRWGQVGGNLKKTLNPILQF